MKRLALVLLVAVAALGFGGTATAGAASCQYGKNTSYKDAASNQIYFAAVVYNCVGVEAVQFVFYDRGTAAGWYDYSGGTFAQHYLGVNIGHNGTQDITSYTSCPNQCVAWVHFPLWWYGACRLVDGRWFVKIKSTATHAWSSTMPFANPQQWFCN